MQPLEIPLHINDSTVFDRLDVAVPHYPASPPVILHGRKDEGVRQSPDHGLGVSWVGLTVLPAWHLALFLSSSPRASNISGTTAALCSLLSIPLICSNPRALDSGQQCWRVQATISCTDCPTGCGSSSPTVALSSITTWHRGHDQGLGHYNGYKEGRWAHF